MTEGRLNGKFALVTGGASGIGAAIVERYRAEGAVVYVADAAAGDSEFELRVDVRDEVSLEAAVERIVSEQGRLHICVANAGISPTIAHTVDLDLATWQRVLDVNLTGVFLTLRAAARRMISAGGQGRLIATCSVAGMAGEAGAAAYCASKFGLRGLIESMALELAPAGITVNAVAPGEVETPLHQGLRELHAAARETTGDDARLDRPPSSGKAADDVRRDLEAWIPAHRMATPSEIAAAYAYLASDEASYVTGTVLLIDGGQLLV